MNTLKQSTATTVPFEMIDTDGAAVTGIVPAVQIRKPSGSFAASTNAASEVGLGIYEIALTAAETDTVGPLIFSVSGTGAETARFQIEVVANKTDDVATALSVVDGLVDTLVARLTSARAGYLDKLDVTGDLAHSDAAATYRATGFATPGDEMNLTPAEVLDLRAAIRTELATELARIDAAVSSRNAATPPTAAAVADAVLDEVLADHTTAGTTGAALAAAGASGDPWSTVVPASYADGTAGAAIGRLNNTPAANPIAILPDPPEDPDLALLVIDVESLIGVAVTDMEIIVSLSSDLPEKTDAGRVIVDRDQTMTHSASEDGRYSLGVEKGVEYHLRNRDLFGAAGIKVTPSTDVVSINELIT